MDVSARRAREWRHELHAIVGGVRLAAPELALYALIYKQRSPATGTRIALAGAIGINLDPIVAHVDCLLVLTATAFTATGGAASRRLILATGIGSSLPIRSRRSRATAADRSSACAPPTGRSLRSAPPQLLPNGLQTRQSRLPVARRKRRTIASEAAFLQRESQQVQPVADPRRTDATGLTKALPRHQMAQPQALRGLMPTINRCPPGRTPRAASRSRPCGERLKSSACCSTTTSAACSPSGQACSSQWISTPGRGALRERSA